jgi:hypothetical protein
VASPLTMEEASPSPPRQCQVRSPCLSLSSYTATAAFWIVALQLDFLVSCSRSERHRLAEEGRAAGYHGAPMV